MVKEYRDFISQLSLDEYAIQDSIEFLIPEYTTEVPVRFIGRIDLLSERAVVEIKRLPAWKEGLGQVIAYGSKHPEKVKILVLYHGKIQQKRLNEIIRTCQDCNVLVETIDESLALECWLQMTKLQQPQTFATKIKFADSAKN